MAKAAVKTAAKKKAIIQTRPVAMGRSSGPGQTFSAPVTRAGDEIILTVPGMQSVRPVGYRILVRDWIFNRKTAGGIDLPDSILESQEHLNYKGQVMEMGPNCYLKGHSVVPSDVPWCKPGDWIVFGKYAGQRMTIRSTGERFRFINDNDVLGLTENPDDLVVYLG